jgi:hypothetical protein
VAPHVLGQSLNMHRFVPLQTCPTKDKWPCPTKPKHDKCVKIKCSEKKPGYSYVTIGNCFGKHIGSIQAEYNGYYGKTCDKYKCVSGLSAGRGNLYIWAEIPCTSCCSSCLQTLTVSAVTAWA